ncbi:MAG: LysE family translocator [Pseudohongiellaceae bacterium]
MNWTEFATIAVAHLFAVASPGPDFAVVTRQSVTVGTRAGIWTSAGVGAGILLHVAYCLLGVALLLSQSPRLFAMVKLIAAAYLFYLGVTSIVRASRQANNNAPDANGGTAFNPGRAFALGFLTNGLNPKATLFFLALFAVVISPATPTTVQMVYGIYLALATFLWFTMLSRLIGLSPVRNFLLRSGVWFERGMGAILIGLAAQIALTS